MRVWSLLNENNTFYTLEFQEAQQMQHLCREYTLPRNEEGTCVRGWIRSKTRIGPVFNLKVCYRDEKYSVEVQVPSLFQDNTVSWVRILNGVDRYVTESMPTAKEENTASGKPIAKARPRHKHTVTWTSVSIPVLERKSKVFRSVKSNHSIIATWSINSSRNRRSDPLQWNHWRMQKEEVRRRFAVVTWRLDIKTGRGRRSEQKIPILCESKLPQSIPVPSSNSRTFRRKCYWSCTARQFSHAERIYRVSLPRREREQIEFCNEKWINSRMNEPQAVFFTTLNPMEDENVIGRNSMRSDETKDHAIQEYLETHSKYNMLVQLGACPRERLVILPNTVTCSRRSLQHTPCILHWEGGMYENYGRALPEGTLNSESVTSCVEIELAALSARSTKPRSKIIFGPIKRFVDYRIAGVPLSAVEPQNTIRENKVKKFEREVREPQT